MQHELIFKKRHLLNIDFKDKILNCLFDASQITDLHCFSLAPKYLHSKELLVFERRKKLLAKKEYLASRFIIKTLIANWHDCSFEMLNVCFNTVKNRLEVFKDKELLPYRVSLSHSKGQVFVAVTQENNELGVDIESIDIKRQIRKLTESFFHSKEQALVELNGAEEFYKLWTLKEAVAKMRGQAVMTILGEDITALSSEIFAMSATYHDFSIALVSSKPSNKITINIVKISLLVKGSHE